MKNHLTISFYNDESWYEIHGITLYKEREVTAIDRKARKVVTRDDTTAT